MSEFVWLGQSTETTWAANWVTTLVSLGGTGLLLYLTVLTGRLRRRDEVQELLDEKDKRIARCEQDITEWKDVAAKRDEALRIFADTSARQARTLEDMTDQAELSSKLLEAIANERRRG